MASAIEPHLPTKEQCNALTDVQCRMIQQYLDPHDIRLNKDWEKLYQPQLIRLYMRLLSYKKIEAAMSSRITASYRTYNNRFKEWCFPVDRDGREQAVRKLYAFIASADDTDQTASSNSQSTLAMRPAQQRLILPAQSQQHAPPTLQQDFPYIQAGIGQNSLHRASNATFSTFGSSGGQSNYTFYNEDDVFSNPRFSTGTAATTATTSTTPSFISTDNQYQPNPLKPPTHDAVHGLWNDVLRVVPCGVDHSALRWHDHFVRCSSCGFTQWHALMIHARSMDISEYLTAMNSLAHVERVDFAGNYPIHYLMPAGVGMDYFLILSQHQGDTDYQNAFRQNPLHLLNPQDLGEQLIGFLQWFKARMQPPGLLLIQRDIYCRTPLQMLLQHPLERHMYRKVFVVFPFPTYHLQSFNNKGHSVTAMMMKAAYRIMSESPSGYGKIQAGIAEVKTYLYDSQIDLTYNQNQYGFHDIARGDRNGMYFGINPICRICHTDNHSNSYLDQLKCACACNRDPNGPDGSGLTPAHAFVLTSRCNNDPAHTPETASQTAELFKILVPADNSNWREIIHVVDPGGHSLVFNVAVHGFDEILEHILQLEDPLRTRAMVNSCAKTRKGDERSVLAAVQERIAEVNREINGERDVMKRGALAELTERLTRVQYLLMSMGAELKPSVTTRWQISFI